MSILVAIDPTTQDNKAFLESLSMTKLQETELVILMIAETFHDSEAYMGMNGGAEGILEMARKNAEAVKDAALHEGVVARVLVEAAASPAESIVKCAEEERVDTIVVGHREKKGMDRFLLGSVAAKVVAHAPCSVLVVR